MKLLGTGVWGQKLPALCEGTVHLQQAVEAPVADSCLAAWGRRRDVLLPSYPAPPPFPSAISEMKKTGLMFSHESSWVSGTLLVKLISH